MQIAVKMLRKTAVCLQTPQGMDDGPWGKVGPAARSSRSPISSTPDRLAHSSMPRHQSQQARGAQAKRS
jgi:hypothetical protein